MTEAQAIAIVKNQFAGAEGFLAQLQRGVGIDHHGVALVTEALQVLKQVWAARTSVPKEAVLPLVDVSSAIWACSDLQPETSEEIERLALEMEELVEGLFLREGDELSEEEAMTTVRAHFSLESSFILALRIGEDLDRADVRRVEQALDTLHNAWATLNLVPKAVVGPMVLGPGMVLNTAGLHPDLEPELEAIASDLRERVKRCLR